MTCAEARIIPQPKITPRKPIDLDWAKKNIPGFAGHVAIIQKVKLDERRYKERYAHARNSQA